MARQSTYEPIAKCQYKTTDQDGRSSIRTFDPRYGDKLIVNKGVIVNRWFKPMDAQAIKDREQQIEAPEKFVHSQQDADIIAGIIVHSGWADNKQEVIDGILKAKELVSLADLDKALLEKKVAEVKKELTVAEMKEILRDAEVVFPSNAKEDKLVAALIEKQLV